LLRKNALAYFCHAVSDERKKTFKTVDFRARRASVGGSETVYLSASTRRSTSGHRHRKRATARSRSPTPAWSTTTASGSARSPLARSAPKTLSSLKELNWLSEVRYLPVPGMDITTFIFLIYYVLTLPGGGGGGLEPLISRGCFFICVRPSYERAVSDLDP
jgi:hypothetical protein